MKRLAFLLTFAPLAASAQPAPQVPLDQLLVLQQSTITDVLSDWRRTLLQFQAKNAELTKDRDEWKARAEKPAPPAAKAP